MEWKRLIAIAAEEPMKCTSLVPGDPEYIVFVNTSSEGAGGVIFGGKEPLQPTVFRVPFPEYITADVVSDKNKSGKITKFRPGNGSHPDGMANIGGHRYVAAG